MKITKFYIKTLSPCAKPRPCCASLGFWILLGLWKEKRTFGQLSLFETGILSSAVNPVSECLVHSHQDVLEMLCVPRDN